ncbi:hypothetical protein C8J57DRAFT_1229564 [Mycena rebaudengoi]|nr:hypothetical protein C8J57DRAFT_1229564 [Mycena rebaudengoi]
MYSRNPVEFGDADGKAGPRILLMPTYRHARSRNTGGHKNKDIRQTGGRRANDWEEGVRVAELQARSAFGAKRVGGRRREPLRRGHCCLTHVGVRAQRWAKSRRGGGRSSIAEARAVAPPRYRDDHRRKARAKWTSAAQRIEKRARQRKISAGSGSLGDGGGWSKDEDEERWGVVGSALRISAYAKEGGGPVHSVQRCEVDVSSPLRSRTRDEWRRMAVDADDRLAGVETTR